MNRISKLFTAILALFLLCGCSASDAAQVPDDNGDGRLTCTLEIRCDALLDRLEDLTPEKAALVPETGVLLEVTETEFAAGDSVFDVFRRVLREKNIHFEYIDARIYNSAYIEGIGNLYEFDCGPQSGWMVCVNDSFLGIGCSDYTLADGDVISFQYTCDLGADLGADYQK